MTKDGVAQIIIAEAKARNHSRDECLAEMSALYQESGWDETIWDPTHVTYGVAQQDGSYPNRFNGAAAQVKAFFDKLDVKRASPGHGDIWLNICWLQQAPNWVSAQYWWDHGRQAYLTEIKSRIGTVTPYLDKYWTTTGGTTVPNAPAYAEEEQWSSSNQPRGGTKVDLFLLHTQEGDGTAASLAGFLGNAANEVSYHYTVDNSVDVRDVVDTDYASWSVLSANNRSINLCFAGSRAAWSRQQWLDNMGKAIDVAAYLAVQDCLKYGIPTVVNPPPYKQQAGISDHRYVTQVLKDGTHTDVGDGFPWDVFATAVAKYSGTSTGGTTGGTNVPTTVQQDLDGVGADGKPLAWRIVTLLAKYAGVGSLIPTTKPGWVTPSVYDHVSVLAKILTRQTDDGKDAFDLLVEIHAAVVKPAAKTTRKEPV